MALIASGLTLRPYGTELFAGLDLHLEPGDLLAVIGPSGAGKTSLLNVVAGLVPAERGRVLLDGVDVLALRRRHVGRVAQPVLLVDALTCRENIVLPLLAAQLHAFEVTPRADELLHQLQLHEAGTRMPADLSGGQRQRLAVGRAVAARPALVVADEPTSELDAGSRGRVLDVLRQAAAGGAMVVLATHDHEVAERCDGVLDLDGRPVQRQRSAPTPPERAHRQGRTAGGPGASAFP